LVGHDTSHSAFKGVMMSIVGKLAALGHSTPPDEAAKNTFVNFEFEHYEIASYSSPLKLAELAGDTSARAALDTSLREKREDRGPSGRHSPPVRRPIGGRLDRRRLKSGTSRFSPEIHQPRRSL
jgi:hypothetical protein